MCLSCDTRYSNILLSETKTEDEESVSLETSISMDCLLIKPKQLEKGSIPELQNYTSAEPIPVF